MPEGFRAPAAQVTQKEIESVLAKKTAKTALPEPPPEPKDSSASTGASVLNYDVASEWGRTPEQAAAEGANVASLKGMACAVRPGVSDADLAALGRLLRNQFDAYDNINIEVFDSLEAAQQSGSDRSRAAAHRVLIVSKHRASGRDAILLIKGDTATPVSREK